ncbi:DnaJ domain-containing protein [Schinkia azotoformans]|uniref:Heat shock protein DnaJ domain-containing protein n=1 Tax=Schinkia azotoformans LMG 9581 TaxID=1131731 RepID=K6CSC3_SCHAZ|nr:DnaJ domain-containing protein [Schinkia azotoformans]EKN63142.1 heat shock protein DnaJ domain-containing protein [Schinkia azotoformans LMG 9581]MEC1640505.1 DnaJ domain-containing protein [Schinkia azotoformans]MEC1723063.1 DnaJ domain-containing protein [Schinkia azotoformans]MEC1944610.1 DnaJ domain-containing protein [Schinkia azotoformans]MED4352787.1 DnaJ domain-containing protein [Schinkia azotoformans]
MDTIKTRKKRRSKPKVENHYKVLGLRSNSRPERIKENYIKLVKEFPPEQHPEEFERIRRAYEVLRDPIKRQEYNLIRKFGGSLEQLAEEANEYMQQENWDKAEALFFDILKVAPDMIGAHMGLAQIYIAKEDLKSFDQQIQLLFESATTEEEKASVLAMKAKMLNDMDYSEEALDVLNLLSEKYPNNTDPYRIIYIQVYQALDREEEAMKLFDLEIAAIEDEEPDYIFLFIEWINTMIYLEKWQLTDKVQKRVRKFLKSITVEDDKLMVTSSLINECENYIEGNHFRAASFYMDLLRFMDPKHPFVIENRANIQELSRVQKEIDRFFEDGELFPLVATQAMTWFYEEMGNEEIVAYHKSMIPIEIWHELEQLDEEFAAGIKRIQKKYPLIYRRYKNDWDKLFADKTSNLNREARRRLK